MEKVIQEKIDNLHPCENCEDIQIKKFTPIIEYGDYKLIDDDFLRCECGKRPLDIVMAHILKIMIEEEIVPQNATLRRNTPVPIPEFCYSSLNPQFINKDSLILIHPDFNKKVADRLFKEVSEVKGVLKGNPQEIVGMVNKDSDVLNYELLAGSAKRTDLLKTLIGENIVINQDQQKTHIEVANTTEEKLIKLYNFLENNDINTSVAIDGMCGLGSHGIFLIKYGFDKVIFNDVYPEVIDSLKENLKLNGIDEDKYEIYNMPFEDLKIENADLCVIDSFPQSDDEKIIEKADSIADNVLVI